MAWIMWNKLKGRDCTPEEQARMEAWIRRVKAEEKKEAAKKK
jgi:hypothetical protein